MSLYVDIEKKVGKFLLKVNFSVNESEIFGLLGESGCGKSMTLKCIAGILTPDKGKIILNDRVLYDSELKINLPPQKRRVGYLFQDYALFPNMTVKQNIEIVLSRKESAEKYMEQFYLEGLEDHYPSMLSGGQRQRCAIARMMAAKPEILLFDEPFNAVDKGLKWNLEMQILEMLDQTKKPALFVSHNRDEVYHLCHTVGIINHGSMKEMGPKLEIFTHPTTALAARMVGCENIFPVKGQSYAYEGVPSEAVTVVCAGETYDLSGTLERILSEEREQIYVIRMKEQYFYYRTKQNLEIQKGDTVYLSLNKNKIWYLV